MLCKDMMPVCYKIDIFVVIVTFLEILLQILDCVLFLFYKIKLTQKNSFFV